MIRISAILLSLLTIAAPAHTQLGNQGGIFPQQSPTQESDKHHTHVNLLADVKSIRPGTPFTVGILMTMDEGWHTYWKNSGEAGIPTEVEWSLPKGFVAGEIEWPLPHKYNESGEILTYGYEKENMLLVQITPPKTLASGSSITLKASVRWLECEHICVPGEASASLSLPVASDASLRDNVALFDRYRRMVPVHMEEGGDVTFLAEAKSGRVRMKLVPRGDARFLNNDTSMPDFYPEVLDELSFGRTQVLSREKEAVLEVPIAAYEPVSGPYVLHGVLSYTLEGRPRSAVVVEIPLPAEFCASLPLVGEVAAEGGSVSGGGVLEQPFVPVQPVGGDVPVYLYFVFALIGGILLNVMPCVLPVIALKIFGLVRMGGDHPAQVKRLAWSFSAGIVSTFLLLALVVVLLQTAGEQVGWGFQFQEPWFIIAMSVIVFAFGLSLFGVYEIGLPFVLAFTGLGSAMEKRSKEGKGYVASFSEGVFATILATPCTAPFLGTAFGFAFSQPAWITILVFLSAGFGMALPYVVFAPRPSMMRFLPKPGEWMVTVKQFMGFLMMATLLWLLYVLGKQLGMEAVIWTSAFLLTLGISLWIVGKFATLNVSRSRYLLTWALSIAVAVFGYWVFMESTLNIRQVITGIPSAGSPQGTYMSNDGIEWKPFSLTSLDSYIGENKTVFIDFTADWCLTCKVNEKTVLTDPEVVQRLNTPELVAIKADWTSRNPDITRLLAKFGRSGVPLYVIFPAGRALEPIILPEVITKGIVLDALNRAMPVTSVTIDY